jgi:DNA-binding NarL/FixJ family response regulator
MSVRIAVSDPLPAFRYGIMAALGDAGFESEAPDDLLAWINDEQHKVVLMTLRSRGDWDLLGQLRRSRPDVTVVAVLEEADVGAFVRAITAGAASAVQRDAPPETVRQVFEAALRGTSLLPIEVVRMLASPGEAPPPVQDMPDPREIEWLQELARGATVAQLADRAGYSERAMFRLLRSLYAKLHVGSRTEALMHAREQGWL